MEKGKLGFRVSFYAVLAFIFVLLDHPLLLAGWFIFVAAFERDEWATRQCMEALLLGLLTLAASILRTILSGLQTTLNNLFPPYLYSQSDDILGFMDFMGGTSSPSVPSILFGLCIAAITIAIWVFALLGAVRTARGHSAHIPLVHKWADWAYGLVAPKPPKPMSHTDYLVHGEANPGAGEDEATPADGNGE